MADSIISARGVRKQFFRKGRESARYFDAVATLDLDLRAGELVAFTGRSGSGKTTLLNMLSGLLEPTEGTVEFEGRDLYQLGDDELSRLRNESFGVIPQGQTAVMSLSVIENVCLPAALYRSAAGADLEQRALELLGELGIAELADSRPAELSGGELRRMAIARALAARPMAIFADEPTGDLDDANTEVVLALLRRAADEGGAVIMATHEQSATARADRIIEIRSKLTGHSL